MRENVNEGRSNSEYKACTVDNAREAERTIYEDRLRYDTAMHREPG